MENWQKQDSFSLYRENSLRNDLKFCDQTDIADAIPYR